MVFPSDVEQKDGKLYQTSNGLEVTMGAKSQCLNQKNVIDPEEIIKNYGSDSARWFMLSDSPPERDINWSDAGIHALGDSVKKFGLKLLKYQFIER